MQALINVLAVLSVVGSAIVTGGQIFCLLAVIPALGGLPQEMSVRVHQDALSERPHRYLRPVSIMTLVASAALLALLIREDDRTAALVLVGVGVAVMVVSGIVSSREWPINHEIDGWGASPVLERYVLLRTKWDAQHRVRTLLSMISLVLVVTATVVSREL